MTINIGKQFVFTIPTFTKTFLCLDAVVLVDGEECGTVGTFGDSSYYDVKCSTGLWGSYVVVYLATSDAVTQLAACEIEIYECKSFHICDQRIATKSVTQFCPSIS